MERKKVSVLILGGLDFIGRNLVEYFKNNSNYLLFFPHHQELELLDADKVAAYIKKNKVDIIINLASLGGARKTDHDEVKLMIHAGFGAEYSRPHWRSKMGENWDLSLPL